MSRRVGRNPFRGRDKWTLKEARENAASVPSPVVRGRAARDAGPGLAALVRPDRGTVPFTGRAAELGELRAWCVSDPPQAVRVLCGEAGVGKTRLALEMAAEHRADGGEWRLVPAGEEANAVRAARAATAGPLLLVVDRAETRPGLDELLRPVPDDPGPVRVLLIARVLGEWWERLIRGSDPAMSQLLTETEPLWLAAPVSEDASDADLAEAAVPYFARALSVDVPERVTVEPADRRVPMFMIHAATLLALLRFSTYWVASLRVVIGDHVLEDLLEYEAHYWQRAASAAGLPAEVALVKQVLAASSLLGAASVAEAADVIARVPRLADCPNEQRMQWAQWLKRLCPPGTDGRLGLLQPDMLAETHVVSQLATDSHLAQSCLRGLSAEQAERALTVLARASEHQDRGRRLIAAALRDDLAGLAIPAACVALQDTGDLGDLLADALDDAPASAEVLSDITLNMPYPSKVLALARLTATTRVRESLPADAEPETLAEWNDREARLRSELARDAAGQHPPRQIDSHPSSISWASPGRARPGPRDSERIPGSEPAKAAPNAANGEAATTDREPQEAGSTHGQPAVRPTRLGAEPPEPPRRFDAPTAHQRVTTDRHPQEAASTRRKPAASPSSPTVRPAEPGHPDDQDRDRAGRQSGRKAASTRRTASRADRGRADPGTRGSAPSPGAEPAATTNRQPATDREPGEPRRQADQQVGEQPAATDRELAASAEPTRPDPLAAEQEAVAVYRELADTNPGKYRADLATALTNLGLRLSGLGRTEEALEAGQEALTIRRDLDAADPDGYRAELATCLVSLGIWFSELGRAHDAQKAEQEAVSIRRELVAIDPARYRPDLAASLANLGITLSQLNRPVTALGPVREAVTIYRGLAVTDPRRYRPDLARCLANLGIRYAELDRPAEALPPSEEAVTIRRELADANPDRYRPDLARSLVNLGFRYCELGRSTDAVPPGGEAVTIYRELAAASPDYRRELARALRGLAVALDALGHDTEAERAKGEAAEIMRELEQSRASGARLAGSGYRRRHQDPTARQAGQRLTSLRT
jgi:tetratricopeptide (TPR) repeat protein